MKQMRERRSVTAPNSSRGVDHWQDPASKRSMIAKCVVDDRKISRLSYLPCLINQQEQPEVLKNEQRGLEVFDFVDKITRGGQV